MRLRSAPGTLEAITPQSFLLRWSSRRPHIGMALPPSTTAMVYVTTLLNGGIKLDTAVQLPRVVAKLIPDLRNCGPKAPFHRG